MAQTGFALVAIATMLLAHTGWAAPSNPALMVTPPQPTWQELTVPQKIVLAPLSDDWDAMEYYRQKKWLSIATRFPEMSPEEQRRIQAQMQTWSKLSPEERIAARELYRQTARMPSDQKHQLLQKWEEYSNLPESEKERLKGLATGPVPVKPLRAAGTTSSLATSATAESPPLPLKSTGSQSVSNQP